jgi:hypothetical protein
MGDKNQLVEVTTTDVLAKTGHGILKALYVTETGDNTWVVRDGTGAVAASGTFTLCTVVATDIVIVNGLTYTGVAGAKSNNTQFSVDTSDCAAATDLAASITCDCRTGTTVTTVDQTAASCAAVVTVTASTIGQVGNDIDISSPDTTITASGATLTGGDGDSIFTVDNNAITNGPILMPYINHPVKDGIYVDHTAGTTGRVVVVYE